ncbi:DNA primase [Myroides odoratimimus]|uniref:DNA primase n=1 Tax=Myroides odoratimimus TaxID=76832 RepID=UPI0026E091E0|nr:DNA primase [Myroides odoratimimus]MDO5858177.1 DNA primase [Myroides odoratimimus]
MSYIKKEFIERLLDDTRIEDIISKLVDLKKKGANYVGLSPFVNEKTPSFVVSPVKQIFKDFAADKFGNVVTFLIEAKNMTYIEAIEYIANSQGISIEYATPEVAEKKQKEAAGKVDLYKVMKLVHELYVKELKNLPDTHEAKQEIKRRGYTDEQVKELGLGFAPANFLYDKLYNSGKIREAEALGLIKEGNKYDLYSNRLVYPIRDTNNRVIGLAGRRLDGDKKNKWINPPVNENNKIYNKSKVWYGIDIAIREARKTREMYICEGYNDVIAFQENKLVNTVAPGGTSITDSQIKELKRHVYRVNLVLDPDDAGKRSMLKHIPLFLAADIRVDIITLPELDPDDYCRANKEQIESDGIASLISEFKHDGFELYLENKLQGDPIEIGLAAKECAKVVASIPNEVIRRHYTTVLVDKSKEKKAIVEKWVAEFYAEIESNKPQDFQFTHQFEFPDKVNVTPEIQKDAQFYNLFMANNQIYYGSDKYKDGVIHFSSISNFQIEYMMHIRDENFPKKLVRVKNIFNHEMVFDTNSDNLNTKQSFYNTLTGNGNFRFDGNANELNSLNRFLMDKMGNGIKIDVLGWQPAGFWVWNNYVLSEDGHQIEMTPDGIIVYNDQHYYVPSANKIYKDLKSKYPGQKKFMLIQSDVRFDIFMNMVKLVHNDFAITALLFAFSSLFSDIVYESTDNFPILFLYGPGGSGKDELARIVQSFTGIPQTAINLESEISTAKAQVREFAQFRNGICQLSEYKRGNPKVDGLIKSLWDRRGYKKANLESAISSDTVDIESSVILTGNDYPAEEPIITRLLGNEMMCNQFTKEQMANFDKLKDMIPKGVSGYSNEILKHRSKVKKLFTSEQRKWKGILQGLMPNTVNRIILNYSSLAAIYDIFREEFTFPFTQQEMVAYFTSCAEKQMSRINTVSVSSRFFELFIASLRGPKDDRLQVGQIVSIEGSVLFFNWTHTYSKISRMWYLQYRESPLSNTQLLGALEKDNIINGRKKHHSYSPGRNGVRTSAVFIDLASIAS